MCAQSCRGCRLTWPPPDPEEEALEAGGPAPLYCPLIPGARRPEVSGTREVKAYGVRHTPQEGGQIEEESPGLSQSGPKVGLTLNRPHGSLGRPPKFTIGSGPETRLRQEQPKALRRLPSSPLPLAFTGQESHAPGAQHQASPHRSAPRDTPKLLQHPLGPSLPPSFTCLGRGDKTRRQAGPLGPTLPPGQVLEGGRGPHSGGQINHMADGAFLAGEAHIWGGEGWRRKSGSPRPHSQAVWNGLPSPAGALPPSAPYVSCQHMEVYFRGAEE